MEPTKTLIKSFDKYIKHGSRTLRQIIVKLLVGFTFLILIIIILSIYNVREDIAVFYEGATEDKKVYLESTVNNRYEEIRYDINEAINNEKVVLKASVDTITKAYDTIDVSNVSLNNRQNYLVISLKNIDEDDLSHDYFVFNSNETGLDLNANENSESFYAEGLEELIGEEAYSNIFGSIYSSIGTYANYYWPRSQDSEPLEKLVYSRYLSKYDVIICMSSYYEDIFKKVKDDSSNKIDAYYSANKSDAQVKAGNVFMNNYDGTRTNKFLIELMGKEIDESVFGEYGSTHSVIMKSFSTEESDEIFYEYDFHGVKGFASGKRIGYAKKIDEFHAYIASAVYVDDIDSQVAMLTDGFIKNTILEIVMLIIIFIITIRLIFREIRLEVASDKKQLEDDEKIFNQLFNNSHLALLVVDINGNVIMCNQKTYNIFGEITKLEIRNNSVDIGRKINNDTYSVVDKNGNDRYLKIELSEYFYQGRNTYIIYITDVTVHYIQLSELTKQAMIDPLVKIPNRRQLNIDADKFTKTLQAKNNHYALAMIDIDLFKRVNDNYGHNVGDEVLKLLVHNFVVILGQNDRFYRYGGEEFLLYLNGKSKNEAYSIIIKVKRAVANVTKELIGEKVTFSAGVVEVNEINKNEVFGKQIAKCDALLYIAKASGRNKIMCSKDD